MAQAAIHQGLAFDAFPLGQDPFAASEVDVSGRQVAQALMGSGMIVVFDCPTSAPVGQIEGLHERRMAGSS